MCEILIVDDDKNTRRTLSDIIGAEGRTVVAVATGQEALSSARECHPDIALVDLNLEDMSGLAVIEGLRKISPGTQCVIVTGHSTHEAVIHALNLGVSKYVQKPYDQDKLLATVCDLAKRTESSATYMIDRFAQHQKEILDAVNRINGHVRTHGEALAANRQWKESHEQDHVVLDSRMGVLSGRLWMLSGGTGVMAAIALVLQALGS